VLPAVARILTGAASPKLRLVRGLGGTVHCCFEHECCRTGNLDGRIPHFLPTRHDSNMMSFL
jgi:hypothetical protein